MVQPLPAFQRRWMPVATIDSSLQLDPQGRVGRVVEDGHHRREGLQLAGLGSCERTWSPRGATRSGRGPSSVLHQRAGPEAGMVERMDDGELRCTIIGDRCGFVLGVPARRRRVGVAAADRGRQASQELGSHFPQAVRSSPIVPVSVGQELGRAGFDRLRPSALYASMAWTSFCSRCWRPGRLLRLEHHLADWACRSRWATDLRRRHAARPGSLGAA